MLPELLESDLDRVDVEVIVCLLVFFEDWRFCSRSFRLQFAGTGCLLQLCVSQNYVSGDRVKSVQARFKVIVWLCRRLLSV